MHEFPVIGTPDFDWEALEASCPSRRRKGYNKKVAKKYPGARVYSNAHNALDLYEQMLEYKVQEKDFEDGDIIRITSMTPRDDNHITFGLENGLTMTFNMTKEKRFCELYGIDPNICMSLGDPSNIIESGIYVMMTNSSGGISGSLSKGHNAKTTAEFINQIQNPTSAYVAYIKERNKGGFVVDIRGINAFLPGGLAAANKIQDFDEYLDTEVTVMIEDYLEDTGTFIVSHKKYIDHILPSMIEQLDMMKKYTGIVTGTAKYGIFIEFDEMFTGLLHFSKMSDETKKVFNGGQIKPGDEMEFWIKEIASNNRIILSEEDPLERMRLFDTFREETLGADREGSVIAVKHFGALVKFEEDIIGLIPKKELVENKLFLNVGDTVLVTIDDIQEDKVFLSIPKE